MKKIGIILNTKKKKALALNKVVTAFIKKKKLEVLNELEVGREKAVREADLIITLGGDGTLLNAVKYIKKTIMPVIAVNAGSFGFITEISPDEVLDIVDNALNGKSLYSIRVLLDAALYRENKKIGDFKALNDVVITKGALSRIMTLQLSIDTKPVTSYFCDGLIIATPTGSTAHSLSAGGPIIHPAASCLVVSPICSHTLSNRPLVVDDSTRVSVSPVGKETKEMALTIDGQEGIMLKEKDILEIKKSSCKIKLISSGKRTYFEVLREKLKWGGSIK
ncbi:MAG: NAD(+)/NADH kinase [Candidatus Omnitrophota bacterium]